MTRRRERRPGAPLRPLPTAIVLCLLWGAVVMSLGTVFDLGLWIVAAGAVGGATLLTGGVVAALLPRRRGIAALSGLGAGAACGAVVLALVGRAALWLGDPATAGMHIRNEVLGNVAPVAVTGPLADAVVAAIACGAFVSLVVALPLRSPVIAGLVPTAVLLVPAAVTGASVGIASLVVAGALLALLVWLRAPRLTWSGPIAAGAAVALAATVFLALPPSRDRVWNTEIVLGPVSSTVPDVTVALADDLRQHNQVSAFSFTSSRAGPIRFTLATLADFEGGRWLPQTDAMSPRRTVAQAISTAGAQPEPAERPDDIGNVSVRMQGLVSEWLPLPQAPAQRVERDGAGFAPGDWIWSADAATARSGNALTRPETGYTAQYAPLSSELPESLDFLAGSATSGTTFADVDDAPEAIRPYLELPGEVPAAIDTAAASATGGLTDRFGIAISLQFWLRGEDFAYSEAAPYEPGTDPDAPYAVTESFLESRSGFCVHYASAFAVMARSLGVPTRINIGYAATAIPDTTVTVRGDDLHAWPEVYFDDVGWVAFEPTPGVGTDRTEGADDPIVTAEPSESSSAEPTQSTADPEPTAETTAPGETSADADQGAEATPPSAWLAGAGWATLVVAVALSPAAVRLLRRRRRIAASERGGAPRAAADLPGSPTPHGDAAPPASTDSRSDADLPGSLKPRKDAAPPGSTEPRRGASLPGRTGRRRAAANAWREIRDTALDLGLIGRGAPPRARTDDALLESLAERGVLAGDALEAATAVLAAANAERFGGGAPPALTADIAERRLLRRALAALRDAAPRPARAVAFLAPRSLLPRPA